MIIRPRILPAGWYPGTEAQVKARLEEFLAGLPPVQEGQAAVAGIAPHAGWEFSGAIALDVIRRFKKGLDTLVVIGGHLGRSEGIYAAYEEACETPLGPLPIDTALLAALQRRLPIKEDMKADNSVEIQLPFIKYFFPDIRIVWLRTGAGNTALALGTAIREAARELSKEVGVLGSTDLTHYGSSYGFAPQGEGPKAVRWVKDVNDKRIIEAMLALKAGEVISLAAGEGSACSAGGAAAAIRFVESDSAPGTGQKKSCLLHYLTSWDIIPGSSFVGYAGIIYG